MNPGECRPRRQQSGQHARARRVAAYLKNIEFFYVYADQHLSKRTFDGDYFKRMMHAQAASASAPVLTVRQLILYVQTEFRVFILFVRHLVWEKGKQALGNELWAQLLHDGGTLANHVKYLALGMQFVDPQVRCLRHLCVREGRGVLWRGL